MLEKHIEDNLELYTEGKTTASQRRILMTQWCGEAWSKVGPGSVVRAFKKLGLTTALDGSEGNLVNIPKLPEYVMPTDYLEEEYGVINSEDELSDSSITSDESSSNESDDSDSSNNESDDSDSSNNESDDSDNVDN